MLEPFQNFNWPRADRRAKGLGLSVLALAFCLFLLSWAVGDSWTIRHGLDYIPREISIQAYEIPSDLVEFSLGLPNYAFGEYFTLETILPPDGLYTLALLLFVLAFSLLAAGVSYFEGVWLYGSLAAIAAGGALFEPAMFNPLGLSGKWLTGIFVFVVVFPAFGISAWLQSWNLSRRWWVLLVFYGLTGLIFFRSDFGAAQQSRLIAGLYLPVLLAAILFIFLNASDVFHGMIILLTRGQGNTQSWLHFTVFSLVYLSNFILIYLRNTGQLVLDIYYLNPFFLQIISMLAGFWILPAKEALGSGDSGFGKGLSSLYSALAIFFLLAATLGFGMANDLVVEVLEDSITLIHFSMGICFFLYILINFYDLMFHGLRVHEVLFRPRYMPVSGIAVFGIAGVFIFLLNSGYFPFFQAMAGRYVFFGDQARREGKALLAEEMYRQALGLESRNQRANLSLAVLFLETGNPEKAFRAAEASLEKNPVPEAFLTMAKVHRDRGQNLEEILCIQEGIRRFPQDGRLLNNAGIAFTGTIFPDSARYYFARAAESKEAAKEGKTNLGFHFLCQGKKTDGLPSRELGTEGDWASLNNQLVFANMAHENAAGFSEVQRRFKEAPENLRAYLLYHSLLNKAINKDSNGIASIEALEDDSIRKYYAEAVDMAKTMLRYRCGNVYSGMDKLLHLYEAGTRNRQDFGLLLGQVYYEQGAYLSAASYFHNAAKSGLKNAWYWYAVACLDAGKKEEAAMALRESLGNLNASDRVRVSILADGLGSGNFSNAVRRSDPEKSAFIKVNWAGITNQQMRDLLHTTSDKDSRRYLWKYCFDRAYRESRGARCSDLFRYAQQFHGKDRKWMDLIRSKKPYLLEINGQYEALEKFGSSLPVFMQARLSAHQGKKEVAAVLFLKSIEEAPMNVRQSVLAINGLEAAGKQELAYQQALNLTQIEPLNPDFLSLYALCALRSGLADFAFQCLPRLEVLSSASRAASLRKYMEEELKAKGLPIPQISNL